MLPTKFQFIWQSDFRGDDFLEIDFLEIHQSETRIACGAILVSDWWISKKSSPLKSLCQMNQNLVGSLLGRFSIKIANLVPIR
jgi:hypothetical protein